MKIFLLALTLGVSISGHAWTVMVMSDQSKTEWINVNGVKLPLKVGQFLNFGDTVITGAGAKVKMIENHSVMVVGEKTTLKIEEPLKKDGPPSPIIMNLMSGKVRFTVDKTEAAKYRYRIPSIVAGVRGTEFVLTASPEKEVLCVLEGEVVAQIIATGNQANVKKNIGWIREGNQAGKLLETTNEQRKTWIQATSMEQGGAQ
ncbi:MAG: FecR family protein [Pseudobdellovibrionaceae bacterium]